MSDEVARAAIAPTTFIVSSFVFHFLFLSACACSGCVGRRGMSPNGGRSRHGRRRAGRIARRPQSGVRPIPVPRRRPLLGRCFAAMPQATGVPRGELPEKLELLWTFSTAKGGFESTAAIVDGVVYVGCDRRQSLRPRPGRRQEALGVLHAVGLQRLARRAQRPRLHRRHRRRVLLHRRRHRQASCGTFKPTAKSTPAPISTATTSCSARRIPISIAWTPTRANSSGSIRAQDQIRCFPTVLDDLGFVAGCDGHLHVIDLQRGESVGEVKIDSPTGCIARRNGRHRLRRHRGAHLLRHRSAARRKFSGTTRTRARRGVSLVGRGDARRP